MPKTLVDPLSTLAQNLDAIAGAQAEVATQVASIRSHLADLEQQRELLQTEPIPPAEHKAQLRRFVEARARQAREAIGHSFSRGDLAPLRYCPTPEGAGNSHIHVDRLASWFDMLCAGAPDLALQVLTGFAASLDLQVGPPSADRPALIAGLDNQIATLRRAEEALVDRATALGLGIEHRSEVLNRRGALAQRAKERAESLTYWAKTLIPKNCTLRERYETGEIDAATAIRRYHDLCIETQRLPMSNMDDWARLIAPLLSGAEG